MVEQLSILIPTYNDVCYDMVDEIVKQASNTIGSCKWEVIVAEDGSTDSNSIFQNNKIEHFPHCRHLILKENIGRAAIRNHLAKEAHYDRLLFIDAGLSLPPYFLKKYILADQADVVCGGVGISGLHSSNLRFLYESEACTRFSPEKRSSNPYKSFRTSNFMILKDVMISHPLRSDIKTYGYEDVIFGMDLEKSHTSICHIDNPARYKFFEPNDIYINKVEESMYTLACLSEELHGYSPLLDTTIKLRAMYLLPILRLLYNLIGKMLRKKLTGDKPSLSALKIYKLLYFASIYHHTKST